MVYKHQPSLFLREFVELFWLRDSEKAVAPTSREAILPDGCAALIINISEDKVCVFEGEGNSAVELSGSVFCGPQSAPYVVLPSAAQIIGVQFRSGGAFPYLSIPMEEVRNVRVELDALYGACGRELRHRLINADSPARKFAVLEKFLLEQIVRPFRLHAAVAHALRRFRSENIAGIAEVLHDVGLSSRRFSRVFSEQVGLTPKLFHRVRRFQRALDFLPVEREVDWAHVALEAGYYDQAHFIHDFRSFCSVTPSAYLAAQVSQRNHLPLRR